MQTKREYELDYIDVCTIQMLLNRIDNFLTV